VAATIGRAKFGPGKVLLTLKIGQHMVRRFSATNIK
jgi:hypothetical protein